MKRAAVISLTGITVCVLTACMGKVPEDKNLVSDQKEEKATV